MPALTNGGGVSAVAVTIALIFLSSEAGQVTAEGAPKRFTNSMLYSIKSTVIEFDFRGKGYPAAAQAIVTNLNGMTDPIHGYGRADHRFSFSAFVWPYEIPTEYVSHNILKYERHDGVEDPHIGAFALDTCLGRQPPQTRKLGKLGWPCAQGGSVLYTYKPGLFASNKDPQNVLVFFHHEAAEHFDAGKKLRWFTNTAKSCVNKKKAFDPWVLAEIAECVYKTAMNDPDKPDRLPPEVHRLRGVAVFPIYKCLGSQEEREESFGVASSGGQVFSYDVKLTSGQSMSPTDQLCIAVVSLPPFSEI